MIVLVVDLDQPARGFIRVAIQALVDVAKKADIGNVCLSELRAEVSPLFAER